MSALNNFHYAMSLMDMLYGVSMQEDQFEEVALIGWNLIGNKRSKLYKYIVDLADCPEYIELPCNLDTLEAVTTDFEEFDNVPNYTIEGNADSAATEAYTERLKKFKSPLYASGKFIKYERVGNRLYINEPYGKVNILYRGEVVDDDGLPMLTDKEATALATYCAYITKYKEGLQTNNANIIQLANTLKQQWLLLVDLARADHHMSQNEWDEVLDAKTSWNRKAYGKSLKLYR